MAEDQIIRAWIVAGGISLVFLFVGALTNRVVVYKDFRDLGWNISLVLTPLISFAIVFFIAGESIDLKVFVTDQLLGQVIVVTTILIMIYGVARTFLTSIQCNGLILGLFIAIAKITIAVFIALCSVGLFNYLFKDKRKLGHVWIFILLFGIFTWVIKVLVNGDTVKEYRTT